MSQVLRTVSREPVNHKLDLEDWELIEMMFSSPHFWEAIES